MRKARAGDTGMLEQTSKTVVNIGGTFFQQGFDGTNAWADDPQNGPRMLHGRELEELRRDADFARPINLRTLYPQIKFLGKEKLGDRDVQVIEVSSPQTGAESSVGVSLVNAAQLALAWVHAQGRDLAPIPGTKRRKYLEENAHAVDLRLTPDEVAELEAAVPADEIAGERYAATGMRSIDR